MKKSESKTTVENVSLSSTGCWTDIVEALEEQDIEVLSADGFESACVGYCYMPWNSEHALIYDKDSCIDVLMDQGMDRTGALEYFSYNVEGAYVGVGTPIFADIFPC
tara:strand:+ start:1624 stop:1944 length:321 start_codon:yes stop_codon:yes gene_type:complete